MNKIFISYSFGDDNPNRNEDLELVSDIEQLLQCFDIRGTSGKRLGGGPITQTVKGQIEECDGLIALLTRRNKVSESKWESHHFVLQELNHARDIKIHSIGLVEEGVDVSGFYQEHEYIPFNRDNLHKAFIALAETIKIWKKDAGSTLKLGIMPSSVAAKIKDRTYSLSYRFVIGPKQTPWKEMELLSDVGMAFAYLPEISENYVVELQLRDRATTLSNKTIPKWPLVDFGEGANL